MTGNDVMKKLILAVVAGVAGLVVRAASDTPARQTVCGGVGVTRFGSTFVYDGAPDLMRDATLQAGNANPREKVVPKETHELGFNYVGVATTRMPFSADRAEQPAEPVHLIDGDPETFWGSHGFCRKDQDEIWIRIDLAVEREIESVTFVARGKVRMTNLKGGDSRAFPERLQVEVARDGYRFERVFDGRIEKDPANGRFTVSFPRRGVKQVMVRAGDLPLTPGLYAASFAEIEVKDADGVNWALVSRGAGVQVNSAYHGDGPTAGEQRAYWPLHWKSGFKWARVGYHDDPINWHRVERRKGVFDLDPAADDAVSELASNGVNVVMCVNFGNRLYTGSAKEWNGKSGTEFNAAPPRPPTTDAQLAAWDRYVEFLVTRFKDRVYCFEVWNEFMNHYWGDKPNAEDYIRLARHTIPLIRRLAPGKKICCGGIGLWADFSEWDAAKREEMIAKDVALTGVRAIAPLCDAVCIHPFYNLDPDSLGRHARNIVGLRAWLESLGFRGEIIMGEWSVATGYPGPGEEAKEVVWCEMTRHSELAKAKYALQALSIHAGNAMPSCYCEMYNVFYGITDLALFRIGRHADPVTPMQPEPAFYAMRNLATAMDGLKAKPFAVEVTPKTKGLLVYTFEDASGAKATVLWRETGREPSDGYDFTPVDVKLPFAAPAGGLYVYEPLNGVRQKLAVTPGAAGACVIRALQLGDSPIVIRQ